MRHVHVSRGCPLLLAGIVCLSSGAFAQQPEAGKAEGRPSNASAAQAPLSESLSGMARAEYEAGRILYVDGDYKTAALKFERAYRESKDPRLLWNMAAAEKNQRHYVRVEELVQRYIDESGTRLTAEERSEAELLLKTVRDFIGNVTVQVAPEGTNVSVDGKSIGTSPLAKPIRLEIGTRTFELEKPGFLTHRESLQVVGGEQLLQFNLEPEVHQGTLRVLAAPGNEIRVDGKVVGTTEWQGVLPSGPHAVNVTADGFRPYRGDTLVQDNQTTTLHIALEQESQALAAGPADSGGPSRWVWLTTGILAAGGLAIAGYYILKPESSEPPAALNGTLATHELALRF